MGVQFPHGASREKSQPGWHWARCTIPGTPLRRKEWQTSSGISYLEILENLDLVAHDNYYFLKKPTTPGDPNTGYKVKSLPPLLPVRTKYSGLNWDICWLWSYKAIKCISLKTPSVKADLNVMNGIAGIEIKDQVSSLFKVCFYLPVFGFAHQTCTWNGGNTRSRGASLEDKLGHVTP